MRAIVETMWDVVSNGSNPNPLLEMYGMDNYAKAFFYLGMVVGKVTTILVSPDQPPQVEQRTRTVQVSDEPQLAKPLATDKETLWSAWIAQEWAGTAEHRLPEGSRVDVIVPAGTLGSVGDFNDVTIYEVEWPEKWPEAIGQAVYYRAAMGGKGGVVLLMGKHPLKQEILYYTRCLTACRACQLRLLVVNVAEADLDKVFNFPVTTVIRSWE